MRFASERDQITAESIWVDSCDFRFGVPARFNPADFRTDNFAERLCRKAVCDGVDQSHSDGVCA